jgi:hypothetical protein
MDDDRSEVVLSAYGVTLQVLVEDATLLPGVIAMLPPGWEPGDPDQVDVRFELPANGELVRDGMRIGSSGGLNALDSALRAEVALKARDRIFIHAGVVARGGRAVVLPGPSLSGKTTLVAALVRNGAAYFSDEFAVLDAEGRVHPYPKPLSLRRDRTTIAQTEVPVEELGGFAADAPAEVALIATVRYVPGSSWDPQRGTAGEGALALWSHAIAASTRPGAVLSAVRAAATGSIHIAGPRGEADAAARELLAISA